MKWLRNLGWPLSLIYGGVVYLRNKFYDWGWFSSKAYDIPILCVGNLSTGGSGKTPMVEWLLSQLLPEKRVAVLSRGYRRKSKGFQLAHPGSTVAQLGDEPLQIARKYPQAIVAVDADRQRGIETLLRETNPELILLDDGFQHRKVRPFRSVLLTAYDELYPLEAYLPAGNLRDHRSQARRADLVVVTKCPQALPLTERDRIRNLLDLKDGQELAFASLGYSDPTDLNGETISMDRLRSQTLTVVTGIARPEPLLAHLRDLGLHFEHLRFRDHHSFTEAELNRLGKRHPILTTEKDATRLEGKLPDVWVLPVRHCFQPSDEAVMKGLLSEF